jgi:hypothetical protein
MYPGIEGAAEAIDSPRTAINKLAAAALAARVAMSACFMESLLPAPL